MCALKIYRIYFKFFLSIIRISTTILFIKDHLVNGLSRQLPCLNAELQFQFQLAIGFRCVSFMDFANLSRLSSPNQLFTFFCSSVFYSRGPAHFYRVLFVFVCIFLSLWLMCSLHLTGAQSTPSTGAGDSAGLSLGFRVLACLLVPRVSSSSVVTRK